MEEREREMDDVAVGLVVSSVLSIRKGGTPAYMRADTSEKATVQPKHMEAAQCRWLTCSTTRWTSMQPEKTDSFLFFFMFRKKSHRLKGKTKKVPKIVYQ